VYTYVVENKHTSPILLEFQNGTQTEVRPGGKYVWQGPVLDTRFLQDQVDAGVLDVWLFGCDGGTTHLAAAPPRVWLAEGF
jgi:hypothetical protein